MVIIIARCRAATRDEVSIGKHLVGDGAELAARHRLDQRERLVPRRAGRARPHPLGELSRRRRGR